MKNSKLLEDAKRGDFLVYLEAVGSDLSTARPFTDLIPVGSILEIVSIDKKEDGLCTIKAKSSHLFSFVSIILIDNLRTFEYKEFIILDKSHKFVLGILYDR